MVVVEHAEQIAAPADIVWAWFVDPDMQMEMSKGFLADIETIGDGVGSIRHMRPTGQWDDGIITERLDVLDSKNKYLEYCLTDTGGIIPFAGYRGCVQVTAAGPHASYVLLRSTFVPVGIADEDARALSFNNFQLLFANLHRMANVDGATER